MEALEIVIDIERPMALHEILAGSRGLVDELLERQPPNSVEHWLEEVIEGQAPLLGMIVSEEGGWGVELRALAPSPCPLPHARTITREGVLKRREDERPP